MGEYSIQIGERRLSNGLTAISVNNPGVSTVAATVALRVSQLDETDDEHGLAYLVGECLDEGTRKHAAHDLAAAVEGLGAHLDCGAGGGTIQCPVEERAKAVRLLREVVIEPAFPAREVRRVQQEILAEIDNEDGEAQTVARRRFRREVFGTHPFARPTWGDRDRVAAYKPADLRRFHRRWFVPADGYVAIAGPLEVEEGLDLLARTFRSFRGGAPAHSTPPAPPMPERTRSVHVPLEREQLHVYLGHPGVRRSDPDFYALTVADHVLGMGSGFTSRVARKLRDEWGLCYSVYATITSGAGLEPSCFEAYIGTSAKHRRKAIDGFVAEIRALRETLPTAQELADVQAYLTGSFVFALEKNANLIRYAIRCKRFDLGFDHFRRYPELIGAVSREQVRDVARRHLDPRRLVVVSAGPG